MSRYSKQEFEKLIRNNPDLARHNVVEYISVHGERVDVTPMPRVNDYPESKRTNEQTNKRTGKYNNRKVECDGHLFDSVKERNRYLELKQMQDAGEISGLVLQPSYCLLPAFTDNTGKKQRGMKYIADFRYIRTFDSVEIIEDVKSIATAQNAVFRLKKKLILHQLKDQPNTLFQIV